MDKFLIKYPFPLSKLKMIILDFKRIKLIKWKIYIKKISNVNIFKTENSLLDEKIKALEYSL